MRVQGEGVSVGELEEALRRRGPDSLGCHRLHLCADGTILGGTVGGGNSLTNIVWSFGRPLAISYECTVVCCRWGRL